MSEIDLLRRIIAHLVIEAGGAVLIPRRVQIGDFVYHLETERDPVTDGINLRASMDKPEGAA